MRGSIDKMGILLFFLLRFGGKQSALFKSLGEQLDLEHAGLAKVVIALSAPKQHVALLHLGLAGITAEPLRGRRKPG